MVSSSPHEFGAFKGVFLPTLLSIVGVVLYLRLGWVVGNAGLLGAFLVVGLSLAITAATALSLSSIASNTRVGPGGPYAILHSSLGYEVGAAIGFPLYLTRPLGTAMYIFGFREGWMWVFPSHNALAVDLIAFVLLFAIAHRSADFAFRVQYFVLAVIGLSIFSMLMSPHTLHAVGDVPWWGDFRGFPERGLDGATFWQVFAVFFPATTGILAGANMSGDLRDPRRAIPSGTLWAIAVSSLVYLGMAWWGSRVATSEQLLTDYNTYISHARWPALVLLGLLGATLSAGLSNLVGGPRILMPMAINGLVPAREWVGHLDADGEPRHALWLTGGLTLVALMLRDLNLIAPLLTMFFLITYGSLNLVVLVERALRLVSFRPTLVIPQIVPLLGLIGCIFAMYIINPTAAWMAVMVIGSIYVGVGRLELPTTQEDVRSSIFEAVAEWAATQVGSSTDNNPRAWRPNLLMPLWDTGDLEGEVELLHDLVAPEGTIKLLGLAPIEAKQSLLPKLQALQQRFSEGGVLCTGTLVDSAEFTAGIVVGLQALQSALFRPNLLGLTVPPRAEHRSALNVVIAQAQQAQVGVLLVALNREQGLGRRQRINLWIRVPDDISEVPSSTGVWSHGLSREAVQAAVAAGNTDLILLCGVRLARAWGAKLTLCAALPEGQDGELAERYLGALVDNARLPSGTMVRRFPGAFTEAITRGPEADLQLLGLQAEPNYGFIERVVTATGTTCVFAMDSGLESALA